MEENNCAEVAQACILEMLFHFALGCYAYSKIVFKCFLWLLLLFINIK